MKKQIGDLIVYDVPEVAGILEMSEEKIRAYVREGRLKGNKVGRKFWIDEADLQAFVRGDDQDGSRVATQRPRGA